jgi:hypothetical protein
MPKVLTRLRLTEIFIFFLQSGSARHGDFFSTDLLPSQEASFYENAHREMRISTSTVEAA